MGRCLKILVAAAVFASYGLAAGAGLAEVESIFIVELGSSPQAPKLRESLAAELTAAGFAVVDEASAADAVLSGVVIMRGTRKRPRLTFTEVVLNGHDGELLWGASLTPRRQLKRIARGIAAEQRHARWRRRSAAQ